MPGPLDPFDVDFVETPISSEYRLLKAFLRVTSGPLPNRAYRLYCVMMIIPAAVFLWIAIAFEMRWFQRAGLFCASSSVIYWLIALDGYRKAEDSDVSDRWKKHCVAALLTLAASLIIPFEILD